MKTHELIILNKRKYIEINQSNSKSVNRKVCEYKYLTNRTHYGLTVESFVQV